jgi:DNA-binding FadR family transcriptional regulator
VENGGDYVRHDLAFHLGLLRACHNRMLVQMSDALGALLRTAVAISTRRPHGPANSLGLHRAVLDAVIARQPQQAERASLALIDSAHDDIEAVLSSRRKLPSVVKSPDLAPARASPNPPVTSRRSAAAAARPQPAKSIKT